MKLTEHVIIVAGGKGTRMGTAIPKQFLELNGLPVLFHTVNAFFRYSETINVILVLSQDDFPLWNELVKKHHFQKSVTLQRGGATRFQSVKLGLEKIEGNGLVAIHDGVRPLVSESIIATSFRVAKEKKSAVASMPLKESIRMNDGAHTKAMDRTQFRLIQTPQTFDVQLIKDAYLIAEDSTLTDDASVAERAGHTIALFEGSYVNIKITTAEDLIIARALLAQTAAL